MTRIARRLRPFVLTSLVAGLAHAAHAQASPAWSVETHTGPTTRLAFEATEGTWMSLSVSPDGRYLAFDLLGHLYEMPIEGGTAKRLTHGRSWNLFPRYSPDGQQLAFSSDRSGTYDVWVMDRAGGGARNVSPGPENVYRPAWSADGRRIFAATSGDGVPAVVAAFPVDGGTPERLVPGAALSSPVPEPGGAALYYEASVRPLYPFDFNPYVTPAGGTRIERYDMRSRQKTVYLERVGGAFAPAPSPDGRLLAFVNRGLDGSRLMIQDLATRAERVVLSGLDRDRQQSNSAYGPYPGLAWHPDGRRILLGRAGRIVSVDVQTGRVDTIPFRAPVERELSQTIRFRTEVPSGRTHTRAHRWGIRTPRGVVHEALGDLWLAPESGQPVNLTGSDAHETSPAFDPATGALYYAAWTDDSLGAVYRLAGMNGTPERLTTIPEQYGSVAVSPDGSLVAYVRGTGALQRGLWLSNETAFELLVRPAAGGAERRVTEISGQRLEYANIAGKIPPDVVFAPDGRTLLFTEFERDTLTLKRIGVDGAGEAALLRFPHAVSAVASPDLAWVAFQEYHRSFLTPLPRGDSAVTVSAYDRLGRTIRVDPEDGAYMRWSRDGRTLSWTRGTGFYEKTVGAILGDAEADGTRPAAGAEAWNGPRVPGSTARRASLALDVDIAEPQGVVALRNARVVTMNAGREVLDRATVVIEGSRITAIGPDIAVPEGARVFDLAGATIIPGLVDAHAHPHIEHSSLHTIEQHPTYLSGPLAYGVTTLVEVYGNEYRDGWMSDMLRAGRITGPRLFTTASVMYGLRYGFRLRMFRPIDNLNDAREQIRWNRDHGAIAVKDYVQITRKRRHLVATAARELGVNVVSESLADPQMNLTQLMDGVTGIEHSMGLVPFYGDVVRYWGATGAGMTPTLLVMYNGPMGEGWYHQGSRLWQDPKLTRFITPEQLMRVRNPTHLWPDDMAAWGMAAELRKLYTNGTSLQMGAHGQMFGLDAHWEMALLAKGGFTPAEVLEISTIRGAAYHGLDGQIGSLEAGKLADLVVLDANPLEDIANAQRIRYVMKHGTLYAGADAARVWPDPRPAGRPYFMRR